MDDDTRLALFTQFLHTSIKYTLVAMCWASLMNAPGFFQWMHSLTTGNMVMISILTILVAYSITNMVGGLVAGIVRIMIATRNKPNLEERKRREEFGARLTAARTAIMPHMNRIHYGLIPYLALIPASYLLVTTRDVVLATSMLLGLVALENRRALRTFGI